ncbi:MAG TPA: L-lactate dehydrogenase [Firmicutes bacterium]|jgi:L-lactate dehydrogenase|nr:L-lactate dehydrogenase [Bacillota bacterium]
MDPRCPSARVAVIGTGFVGSTFAYTVMLRGVAAELVLIDVNKDKAEGDAMDLNHGLPFARPMRIWAGDYEDTAEADVIVIAAGASQKPGETRLDLVRKNTEIFRSIIGQIMEHNPKGIILVATNPVDILTYASLKLSGLPPNRVLGSGTILDTARFRYLLGMYADVDPRSVHAYILGEHGDTELPVWSLADIGGMPIPEFFKTSGKPYDTKQAEELFQGVRDAAYTIIEKKGSTYYAIAMGLERIVECILRDENSVLSVSTLLSDFHGVSDICLGVPAVINRTGVSRVIELPLNPEEQAAFRHSAKVLQEVARSIGL